MRRNAKHLTHAERVIREISDLRELGRRLSIAGQRAGLHKIPWVTVTTPAEQGRHENRTTTARTTPR